MFFYVNLGPVGLNIELYCHQYGLLKIVFLNLHVIIFKILMQFQIGEIPYHLEENIICITCLHSKHTTFQKGLTHINIISLKYACKMFQSEYRYINFQFENYHIQVKTHNYI